MIEGFVHIHIRYSIALIACLWFSMSSYSQTDTIKKQPSISSYKPFFDAQKKTLDVIIGLPEKRNPLFNLNKTKALVLKPLEYYLNLGNNNTSKQRSFMAPRKVDSDVLVQRNFNGQNTSNPKLKSSGSLGTIESSTKFVRLEFRDFGIVDGDRVRIYLNERVVEGNITLKGISAFIELPLRKGYNRIDFKALNQGIYGPNTAQFFVYDDKGKLIKTQAWNIGTGQLATLGVIRY